jgi:hypothetical protein
MVGCQCSCGIYQVGAKVGTKRYVQAMTALEGGPVTCHVRFELPWIEETGFLCTAMTPPTI